MRSWPSMLCLMICVGALATAAEPQGNRDVFVFGRDRMRFPSRYDRLDPLTEQVKAKWRAEIPQALSGLAKSPFRADVVFGTGSFSYSYFGVRKEIFVRDSRVYGTSCFANIGFFLDKIADASQFEAVLAVVDPSWPERRINPIQFDRIVAEIEARGRQCPLQIYRRDIERDLIAKGTFCQNGIWMLNVLEINDACVVECKYAMNGSHHFAELRRTLIAPPRSGPDPVNLPGHRGILHLERGNPFAVDIGVGGPVEARRDKIARWQHTAFLNGVAHFPQLKAKLETGDEGERVNAAGSLGNIRETSARAVKTFKEALRSSNRGVRNAAILDIPLVGPAAKDAIPELVEAASDLNSPIYFVAVESLGTIGPAAKPALRELLANESTEWQATKVLGDIGDGDPETVRALQARLRSSDASLRAMAAESLGSLGPAAHSAVADLISALNDPDDRVRAAAADSLGRIGPAAKEAIPALEALLEKSGTESSRETVGALLRLNHPVKNIVANFVQQKSSFYYYLNGIGACDVPELRKILKASDAELQANAAMALGIIGPGAKDAVTDLTVATSDKDLSVRVNAIVALGKIGPGAAPAVGELRKLLSDPDETIRQAAALSLGQIGRAAEAALPDLKKIQETEVWPLTDAAYDAIQKIQNHPPAPQ